MNKLTVSDQVLIDQLADNGGMLIPTGQFNPERRVVVGDLLSVRKRNGEVTQTLKNTFVISQVNWRVSLR